MVRYISFSLVLIILLLAMISKKNYSKYKDGGNPLKWLARNIECHLSASFRNRIRGYIRKVKTLNVNSLDYETETRLTKYIYDLLLVLVVFLVFVCVLSFIPEEKKDPYVVERPSIGDSSSFINVVLEEGGSDKMESFKLEIKPRQLTEKEFEEAAEKTKKYIDSVMLGKNKDREHICSDLNFPRVDESGFLRISWETDLMTIIGSDGIVENDDLEAPTVVNITATIKDEEHKQEYHKQVTVINKTELSDSEKAKVAILDIEEENRSQDEFVLPKEVGNVRVSRDVESSEERSTYILLFGLLIIGIWSYYRIYKLKEKGENRDKEIRDAYYGFVNRLTIYMGAGFTLRKSLVAAVRTEPCKYLYEEVEFTMNMVESGVSESKAYGEMGRRIGLEEYMKLMSLISQNLTLGNSNLLKLLDTEVKTSYFLKKENVRKKGEQASEKLLLPSAMLMMLVIIVVMYPAFIGMK